jgi:hypothetical protein
MILLYVRSGKVTLRWLIYIFHNVTLCVIKSRYVKPVDLHIYNVTLWAVKSRYVRLVDLYIYNVTLWAVKSGYITLVDLYISCYLMGGKII